MSRNQMIAVAAAVIIASPLLVGLSSAEAVEEATSQPPRPAPSQQQTPPQPQQP